MQGLWMLKLTGRWLFSLHCSQSRRQGREVEAEKEVRRLDRGHPANQWRRPGETLDTTNSPKSPLALSISFCSSVNTFPPSTSLCPHPIPTPNPVVPHGDPRLLLQAAGRPGSLPPISPEEGMRQAAECFPAHCCQWELLGVPGAGEDVSGAECFLADKASLSCRML